MNARGVTCAGCGKFHDAYPKSAPVYCIAGVPYYSLREATTAYGRMILSDATGLDFSESDSYLAVSFVSHLEKALATLGRELGGAGIAPDDRDRFRDDLITVIEYRIHLARLALGLDPLPRQPRQSRP